MCQRVIEKAADLPGVNKASWNKETKVLSLNYNSEQVKFEDIYKAVAASGYDTEYITAPDSAYQALHSCCLYREPEVVNQH
jgi:cation transport ATPase